MRNHNLTDQLRVLAIFVRRIFAGGKRLLSFHKRRLSSTEDTRLASRGEFLVKGFLSSTQRLANRVSSVV